MSLCLSGQTGRGRAHPAYTEQLPVGESETHRVLQPRDVHILHYDAHHSVIQDLPHLVVLLFGAVLAELSWQHGSSQPHGAASSTCWWLAQGWE